MAGSESSDLRECIREMTLRIEGAVRVMDRKTDTFAAEIVRQREEMRSHFAQQREEVRAHFEQQQEHLEEVRQENQAQREALFRILDRLDNGGGAAPAT